MIEGVTTAYGYGRLQYGPQLSSVTDALGQWIGYEFDAWGRMTQRSFYGDDATADAGELYHYDAWGRVDSFTDCNGAKTEFAYDLLGKLTQKKYYTGQTQSGTVEYAYNSAGQLASIVSDCTWGCSEQVHYSYDKLGRLQYRSGVGYGSIAFQRDAMGRTKTLSWMKESEKQTSLSYSYDMAQRVVGVYQDNGVLPLASYSFDAAGAVETVMLENGAYVEYEYDETYGYLTALRNKSATGEEFASFEYSYDLDGLVERVDLEDNSYILYDYDNQNRLTDEWKKTSGAATVYRHQYQYDNAGNRTQHIHTDDVSNATTFTLTYNDLNQLTLREWDDGTDGYKEEYSYDLNGNLTRKDELFDPDMMSWWETMARWDYSWDHENRLIQVVHWKVYNDTGFLYLRPWKRVEFYYCPACGGNRTQKVVYMNDNWSTGETPDWTLTKWLRYETLGLDQLRVDEKYDSDQDGLDEGDPYRTERVTYTAPGDVGRIHKETLYTYSTPYTSSNPEKEDTYFHYSWLGDVAGLTGGSGSLLAGCRYSCDAFGVPTDALVKTSRRLTAKQYDPDLGLYDFAARWYAPALGRFISGDPSVFAELFEGSNLYVFSSNNPVMFLDLTGLSEDKPGFWEDIIGFIPVIGPARDAVENWQNEEYGSFVFNVAMAISDLSGAKAAASLVSSPHFVYHGEC